MKPAAPAKPRVYFVPVITLPLGDGTYRVAPGRPVERLNMDQACQMTGLTPRDLRGLVETGDIHAQRPAPRRWWFFAEELAAFLAFTVRHPNFWNNLRVRLAWREENPFHLPDSPVDSDATPRPAQGDFFAQ